MRSASAKLAIICKQQKINIFVHNAHLLITLIKQLHRRISGAVVLVIIQSKASYLRRDFDLDFDLDFFFEAVAFPFFDLDFFFE